MKKTPRTDKNKNALRRIAFALIGMDYDHLTTAEKTIVEVLQSIGLVQTVGSNKEIEWL